MKNILFLADPNSIHDVKWISYFHEAGYARCFVLPRDRHFATYQKSGAAKGCTFEMLNPIHDFSVRRFLRTLKEAIRIKAIIAQKRIDLIHILYAEPNALWCLFRDYFNVPMIISARGSDVLRTIPQAFHRHDPLNKLVSTIYRRAFRKADWITGTSQAQFDSISKFSTRSHGMSIVRTGIDRKKIEGDTSGYFPLSTSRSFILFPRYMRPVYNHTLELAAIAMLPPSIKQSHVMVFLGRNGGDEEYEREILHLMEAQPEVTFEFLERQSQESLFELYKRASVVVMTPLSDGSPVSGMEALLCGSKLILGPLHYDSDIFSQAIRMQTWDAAELAALITRTLDDPHRPQLSAKEIAAMDREANMTRMQEIYQSLVGSSGSIEV